MVPIPEPVDLSSDGAVPGARKGKSSGIVLAVDGLHKTYNMKHGPVHASRGLSFSLTRGEVLSLVGPSGCGKTTALRCVAGLEHPDHGLIRIGDQVVFDSARSINVPTHHRPIGMVFQSYAVWPHMTVAETVAYPLEVARKRLPKDEIARRVNGTLELVRIRELADRNATQLSGGQQQRVAIARCLVRDADILLFDEPLSNLDAKLRDEMRAELRQLFEETQVSVLYVTHDLNEALALSNRLIVLNHGQVVQEGPPEDIYFSPRSNFVAHFMGSATLLTAFAEADGSAIELTSALGSVRIPESASPTGLRSGRGTMLVRPEFFALEPSDGDSASARIDTVLFIGSVVEYRLSLRNGEHVIARRPAYETRYSSGTSVSLRVDPRGVTLIPSDDVTV